MKKQMEPLGMLGWMMHSATCVCQRNASGIGATALCEPTTRAHSHRQQAKRIASQLELSARIASRLELLRRLVVGWLG